jgi:hypothetical protein
MACAIGLWALFEWLSSPVIYLSRTEAIQVMFYCIIGIAAQQLQDRDQSHIIKLILGLGLINCGFVVLEEFLHRSILFTIQGITPSCIPGRYNGLLENPNTSGEFAAMSLGLLLMWLIAIPRNRWQRLIGVTLLALCLEAIVATQSRGATVLAFVIICLLLPVQWVITKNKQILQFAGVALLLLTLMIYSHRTLVQRLTDIQNTQLAKGSTTAQVTGESTRIEIWKGSLRLWLKEPVLGIHPSLLDERWLEVQPENIQAFPYKSHSFPITILCEYGLVGAILALLTLSTWGYQVGTNWKRSNTSQQAAFIGASILLAGDLIDFSLYAPLHGAMFFILAAISITATKPSTEKQVYVLCCSTLFGILLLIYSIPSVVWCYELNITPATIATERIQRAKVCLNWMPDNAFMLRDIATLYEQQGDKQNASKAHLAAFKADPFNLARLHLAFIIHATDARKADAMIQSAIKTAPNYYQTYTIAADYYRQTGRTNQATIYQTRADYLKQFIFKGAFKIQL